MLSATPSSTPWFLIIDVFLSVNDLDMAPLSTLLFAGTKPVLVVLCIAPDYLITLGHFAHGGNTGVCLSVELV